MRQALLAILFLLVAATAGAQTDIKHRLDSLVSIANSIVHDPENQRVLSMLQDTACLHESLRLIMMGADVVSHDAELDEYYQTALAAAQAEMLKRQKEADLREAELKSQISFGRMLTMLTVIALVVASALAFWAVNTSVKKHKLNSKLDQKNRELEHQKEEFRVQNDTLEQQKEEVRLQNERLVRQKQQIEQQKLQIEQHNRMIVDSIDYASMIQSAALPTEESLAAIFGECMMIYKPLYVVSGDFVWAGEVAGKKLLAVADCTGHGVPGAFLSMLGMSIMNDLLSKCSHSMMSAAEILDEAKRVFKDSLHQQGRDHDNHDGIDMALVIIDPVCRIMNYAGAMRPIVLVRNGQAIKLETDRMPIGVHYHEAEHFTNHVCDLHVDDVIYLYTDGFPDQFGYDHDGRLRKFTARQLRSVLAQGYMRPFCIQKAKLLNTLDEWRTFGGNHCAYEQTDDATLVGIRIHDFGVSDSQMDFQFG